MVSHDTPPHPMDATGSNMMPTGSSMESSDDTGSNMMPAGSSMDEMPGGGGMSGGGPQATPKGMQSMGSNAGMFGPGQEVCKAIVPDVPILAQCPIPAVSAAFRFPMRMKSILLTMLLLSLFT